MKEPEKTRLIENISSSLSKVSKKEIIQKCIEYFSQADSDLGNRLKKSVLK
jgi:catalase